MTALSNKHTQAHRTQVAVSGTTDPVFAKYFIKLLEPFVGFALKTPPLLGTGM